MRSTPPTKTPWPPTGPGPRHHLLAQLAHGYYVEGTSKVALGKKSNLSRFQVAALLQEAQDTGVVRIEISVPHEGADTELARLLGLQRIITVGTAQWPADRDALAKATAREITELLQDDGILGMSWSRTLQLTVQHLPDLPRNDVIQLAGALSDDDRPDTEPPRLLATLNSRTAWPLWAPLVVEQAASLKKSPEIDVTLRRADALDVAVFAVGGWEPKLSTVWPRVGEDVAVAARDAGAVGEISGHLIDARGHELDTPVSEMIVSASISQLRAAKHKVAVAGAAGRTRAVLAAVSGGLVDTLVCDVPLRDELERLAASGPSTAGG